MKRLTLAIDADLLQRARIYAAARRTTVADLMRDHLVQLVGRQPSDGSARDRLLKLIDDSPGRMGPGWKFDRAATHER
jgi:hypothetical protein